MPSNLDQTGASIKESDYQESMYRDVYCDLTGSNFEDFNDDITEVVADQFDMDKDLVELILLYDLSETKIGEYLKTSGKEQDSLPKEVRDFIFNSGDAGQKIKAWADYKNNMQIAYDKEVMSYRLKKNMKYKLKASERFYNGSLGDTPFDIIVDLNLIEIILFGDMAEWESDVYKFPSDEDDKDNDDVKTHDTSQNDDGDNDDVETQDPASPKQNKNDKNTTDQECIPDDEDGNIGGNPPKDCGNGVYEPLFNEECDDGNNISGDGCSQYCKNEDGIGTESSSDDLICIDPEAVTFKSFNSKDTSGSTDSDDTDDSSDTDEDCPPGTHSKNKYLAETEGADGPERIEQHPKYPGENKGGVLKNFPESNKPACPEGYSEIKPEIVGKTPEEPVCIQTELCASFEDVRKKLYGDDYKEDEIKDKMASSIEAFFCVELEFENRPLSPYSINDGCIDCHIAAMADSLEKLLSKSISPKENTQGSFALSSHWGPTFSFDLTTYVKSKISKVSPEKDSGEEMNKKTKQEEEKQKIEEERKKNTTSEDKTAQEILEDAIKSRDEIKAKFESGLENYKVASDASGDLTMRSKVTPLIIQMQGSFKNLNVKYNNLATTLKFLEKEECQF